MKNKYFKFALSNFNILFYPFILIYKKIKAMIYKSGLEKLIEFDGESICDYLIEGTSIDKREMQYVINAAKRKCGYKNKSDSGELDYTVRKLSYLSVTYSIKNKMSVSMAYLTITNNSELYLKLMR